MSAISALKYIFISILAVTLLSCDNTGKNNPVQKKEGFADILNSFKDTAKIKELVKSVIKEEVIFTGRVNDGDTITKLITVISTGVQGKTDYGIRFSTLEADSSGLKLVNQTELLDGIKDLSHYGETRPDTNNKKFLYYDSWAAFIGSGNTEVYIYLYEPEKSILYSLHAELDGMRFILTYSDNLKSKDNSTLRNWLTKRAEKSMPALSGNKTTIRFGKQ